MGDTRSLKDLATAYRELWDSLDAIESQKKQVVGEMADLELRIRAEMEKSGKVNDGDADTIAGVLRVAVRHKWRATYDPEQWPSIMKALVASGNEHLVQRRLVDSRVMDLVDNGIPLPDGLRVEQYTDLDMRRL